MELGLPEILIILVVVLLLFGPTKLAQLGESLGRGIRNFRDAAGGRGERPAEAPPQQAGLPAAFPRTALASPPDGALDPATPAEPVEPGVRNG